KNKACWINEAAQSLAGAIAAGAQRNIGEKGRPSYLHVGGSSQQACFGCPQIGAPPKQIGRKSRGRQWHRQGEQPLRGLARKIGAFTEQYGQGEAPCRGLTL